MPIAGKVSVRPRGDYDATEPYTRLDLVRYGQGCYICRKTCTGILPTDEIYWMNLGITSQIIDDALSDESENPVQNKVVTQALNEIIDALCSLPATGQPATITVDDVLSADSSNPVKNSVLFAKFNELAERIDGIKIDGSDLNLGDVTTKIDNMQKTVDSFSGNLEAINADLAKCKDKIVTTKYQNGRLYGRTDENGEWVEIQFDNTIIDPEARAEIANLRAEVQNMSGYKPPTLDGDLQGLIGPPKDVNVITKDASAYLRWQDPENEVSNDGQVLARWAGTKIVRKEGSAPTDEKDGKVIADSKIKNGYSVMELGDTELTNGVKYFYGIFPYTVSGKYNCTKVVEAQPISTKPEAPYNEVATVTSTGIKITYKKGKNTKRVRLVYNKDISPKTPFEGTIVDNFVSGTIITDLEDGTLYYFKLFAFNNSGDWEGGDLMRANTDVTIVTFADGSWKQITKMLNAHYKGLIDIADYWRVNDERTITLDDIPAATYNSKLASEDTGTPCELESQLGGKFKIRIIAINSCMLGKSIGKRTNSAVTLQFVNCLYTPGIIATKPYQRYDVTPRHQWLNDKFIEALPSSLQSLIKTVYQYIVASETYDVSKPEAMFIKCKAYIMAWPFDKDDGWNVGDTYSVYGSWDNYYQKYGGVEKKYGDDGKENITWATRSYSPQDANYSYVSCFNSSSKKQLVTLKQQGMSPVGICPTFNI